MDRRDADKTSVVERRRASGLWDLALAHRRDWEPAWAKTYVQMTTYPWTVGVLSRKCAGLLAGSAPEAQP
jgi:hypothetical protein